MFLELLPRLSSLAMPDQVLDCLDLLASCLSATPAARLHWHKLYTSNLPQSAQLIQYLGEFKSSISSYQSSYILLITSNECMITLRDDMYQGWVTCGVQHSHVMRTLTLRNLFCQLSAAEQ